MLGISSQDGKMEPGDRDIIHHMALVHFSTSFCHHSEPLESPGDEGGVLSGREEKRP